MFRVPGDYEYGVAFRRTTSEPHRLGMTEIEASTWIKEFIEDGGRSGAFVVIRRPMGDWEVFWDV